MPLYDFQCTNKECAEYEKPLECICKYGQIADCKVCKQPMQKLIMPPETPKVPHISWSSWRVGIGLDRK